MPKTKLWVIVISCISLLYSQQSAAQTSAITNHKAVAKGLQLREIGPAVMGGRIADIAVNPQDKSTWYVAVDRKSVV